MNRLMKMKDEVKNQEQKAGQEKKEKKEKKDKKKWWMGLSMDSSIFYICFQSCLIFPMIQFITLAW